MPYSIIRFKQFNWNKYKGFEVFKLRLKSDYKILGLMCIIDHVDPHTNAIEIELLEVCAENVGSFKKLDCISGCLIAFACRESFIRGHDGYVFLTPKTNLIEHYRTKYGFSFVGIPTTSRPQGFMIADTDLSKRIIKTYIDINK